MQGQEYCTVRVCRGMHVFGCMMQVWQPAIMWREGRLDRRIKRQFNAVTPPSPPLLPIQPNRPQKMEETDITSNQNHITSFQLSLEQKTKEKSTIYATQFSSHAPTHRSNNRRSRFQQEITTKTVTPTRYSQGSCPLSQGLSSVACSHTVP